MPHHAGQVFNRSVRGTAHRIDRNARARQIPVRRQRIDPGMREDVGPRGIGEAMTVGMRAARPFIGDLHDAEERKARDPIDHLGSLLARKGIESARRGRAAVHLPYQQLAVVFRREDVEKHALVVAHEHASIGKGADEADHADGIGPAVDHIAQHVDRIIGTGRCLLERAVERAKVTVRIRGNVCRHRFPLS